MAKTKAEREHTAVFLSLEVIPAIPSILDQLSPSTHALAETAISVQEHWNQRMRNVASRLAEVRLLLAEYRGWLSGQSVPGFERSSEPGPDGQLVPEPIEVAQKLERRSRMAQEALNVQAREFQRECDSAFESAKSRLEEAIRQTLDERACLTARASTEGAMCDQEQWPPEVITLLREITKLLVEIDLHRQLLRKKRTTILEWADMPDVYLPEPIEDARLLKKTSKRDRDKCLAQEKANPKEEAAAE